MSNRIISRGPGLIQPCQLKVHSLFRPIRISYRSSTRPVSSTSRPASYFKEDTLINRINQQGTPKIRCFGTGRNNDYQVGAEPGDAMMSNAVSAGILVLWLCLGTYAIQFSPNQTPYRDTIFIKLLVGLSQDSSFSVNQVYASVFNIIGLYTFYFQALLIPGGRSANKVPAWPFVVLGYGFGAFALLPFMALWRPDRDLKLPLPVKELEGWDKLAIKGAETKILPAVVLAAGIYQLYNMFVADGSDWIGYLGLFDESRLVHISSIDCCILTALCPFWMSNDAELRDWKDREKLLPILSFLPVVGPAIYLLLRPKTGENNQD